MKKNNKLFRTNVLVSVILITGFTLTALLSYQANYQASLDSIEQVSSLTAEGIYYQLTTMFTKPVNVSLTMAHDSLLAEHLANERDHLNDAQYTETTKNYLEAYRDKYGFDAVFLVSTATNRYYNFNGVDRILNRDNPENVWYYSLLESEQSYDLVVDNDEVEGADNEITVFVNCKITDGHDQVLGIVGVGIRIHSLKELLKSYEEKFAVQASLISDCGIIEISTTYTGYEHKDWFEAHQQDGLREQILGWHQDDANLEVWYEPEADNGDKSYVVTRFIPELSWHLVVEQNTGQLVKEMRMQVYQNCLLIAIVILIVLFIITLVIRKFNHQITELMEERQAMFKQATEQLYDNIYEINLTANRPEGKRTEEYFSSLGAGGLPYDEGLRVVAEKQIKPEHRAGYIAIFHPANAIKEYESGNDHLRYDFMVSMEDGAYQWMRIDAYIFHSSEDDALHMFIYRKNIDQEKQKELQADLDEMTMFYTKTATERIIDKRLQENPAEQFAFFIFDMDNFKQANDRYGHAFGDQCIREFTQIIRQNFRKDDVLGRLGGDEFAAFIPIPNELWVEAKAKELIRALDTTYSDGTNSWKMSASIGISIAPMGGTDCASLYKNADKALYQSKQCGKNGYTLYCSKMSED